MKTGNSKKHLNPLLIFEEKTGKYLWRHIKIVFLLRFLEITKNRHKFAKILNVSCIDLDNREYSEEFKYLI